MRCLLPVVALLAPWLSAQTFVVDIANGPGTNFTDIAAAAAAVPSGSVLLVRPGLYGSPVSIHGKSLTILGGPGVRLGGPLADVSIDALLPGQIVVVRGVEMVPFGPYSVPAVLCSACQGSIVLDEVTSYGGFLITLLDIDQCAQVQVSHCAFVGMSTAPAARATASDVTFVASSLVGAGGMPGLRQIGGRVHLVDTTVTAQGATFFYPATPAVDLQGGQFRCDGSSSLQGGGGVASAIVGTATARIDPATTLAGGAPLIAPTIAATFATLPSVHAAGGDLGGVATATMTGAAGQLGVLSIGLPGQPVFVPGWVDPVSVFQSVPIALAVLGAPLTANVPVPNLQALLGQPFGWQGLAFDVTGALQLSNGAWFVLR